MSAGNAGLGMNLLRRTQFRLFSKYEKAGPDATGFFILLAGARFALFRQCLSAFA